MSSLTHRLSALLLVASALSACSSCPATELGNRVPLEARGGGPRLVRAWLSEPGDRLILLFNQPLDKAALDHMSGSSFQIRRAEDFSGRFDGDEPRVRGLRRPAMGANSISFSVDTERTNLRADAYIRPAHSPDRSVRHCVLGTNDQPATANHVQIGEPWDRRYPCPSFDGNNHVDANDLAFLLAAWGTPDADLNFDGTTNKHDLAILKAAWGDCDPFP